MLIIMLNVYHSPWTRHTIPQFKIYRAIISGIFEIFTKLSQTVSIYLMNYDQYLLPLISCSTVIKIIIQRKSVLCVSRLRDVVLVSCFLFFPRFSGFIHCIFIQKLFIYSWMFLQTYLTLFGEYHYSYRSSSNI